MKIKVALLIAALAGVLALMVPNGASARAACVVVDGPGHLHLQVGYAPTGPAGCRHLP